MKAGDLVGAFPPGGLARKLKAWSAWNDTMKFFEVPYAATGTVIEVLVSGDSEWCKVLFPQGLGWVMSDSLELL